MQKRNNAAIYICGNPLFERDNIPILLLPWLKQKYPGILFQTFDPNENFKQNQKEIFILDSAEGIDRVEIIQNIEQIAEQKIYSMHDLDLAMNLKLLKKIGKLEKITIFAIPSNMDIEAAKGEISKAISSYCFFE